MASYYVTSGEHHAALREIHALRSRVAELEEALRVIIHESEHTLNTWKERADHNAATARAALNP